MKRGRGVFFFRIAQKVILSPIPARFLNVTPEGMKAIGLDQHFAVNEMVLKILSGASDGYRKNPIPLSETSDTGGSV
jgi:hypothetical protein